jgi:NhaP-type Na+/H+ or K+/H+ antiporter
LGAGVGLLVLGVRRSAASSLLFDPRVFFFVLLPPIVFRAGYNMRRQRFFAHISPILTLASAVGSRARVYTRRHQRKRGGAPRAEAGRGLSSALTAMRRSSSVVSVSLSLSLPNTCLCQGTLIAYCLVAFPLYYLSRSSLLGIDDLSLRDAFFFAALITSVDSGAVLGILDAIDADLALHSIVFGESMLNDAVALVLFHTLTQYGDELLLKGESILTLFGLFIGMSLGSIAIGGGVALVSELLQSSDRGGRPASEQRGVCGASASRLTLVYERSLPPSRPLPLSSSHLC